MDLFFYLRHIKQRPLELDCHYCPQPARYNTGVEKHELMSCEEVRTRAEQAKEMGALRVCLGAAWREVKDNEPFDRVLDRVKDMQCGTCFARIQVFESKLWAEWLTQMNVRLRIYERRAGLDKKETPTGVSFFDA